MPEAVPDLNSLDDRSVQIEAFSPWRVAGRRAEFFRDPFDAAPFAEPLPGGEGEGLMWEDPREIRSVFVKFAEFPAHSLRLEYWGSRWPQQHLPKDREPGGGDAGWMELGNWSKGGWRVADTHAEFAGNTIRFTFEPIKAKEFPDLKDYFREWLVGGD